MNDMKVIVRLLAAIRASEDQGTFNLAYVRESALQTTERDRDNLAIKLQKAGYIEGLYIVDDIDNQKYPVVLWKASRPTVTLEGLQYIHETEPIQNVIREFVNGTLAAVPSFMMNAMIGMMS